MVKDAIAIGAGMKSAMIDETTYIIESARDGMSMEAFASSTVGKIFLRKAEQVEREAELEFRNVDPENGKAVREVQNRLLVVDMFRKFMVDCISEGNVAEAKLLSAEQTDY